MMRVLPAQSKMFVKGSSRRKATRSGSSTAAVRQRHPAHDDYVPVEFRSHDDWGPQVIQQGYYSSWATIGTTALTAVIGDPC